MVSFSTHVSEVYVTIGLMTVQHNFHFEYLVTNLLLVCVVLHHYYLIFCFGLAITKLRIGTWLP